MIMGKGRGRIGANSGNENHEHKISMRRKFYFYKENVLETKFRPSDLLREDLINEDLRKLIGLLCKYLLGFP